MKHMSSINSLIKIKQSVAACMGMGMLALAGCSNTPTTPQVAEGVPEIQGIWRYSEGAVIQARRSVTFEFAGSRFQVYGQPAMLARGRYQVVHQQEGVYHLQLDTDYDEQFGAKKLEVSPAVKGLLIDRKLYRRIVRQ